jgi:hypothetical protein
VTDATQGAAEDSLAAHSAREGALSPSQALFAGVRQPIVLILLLIAFFTTISGKPLDGLLMLMVATLLVWDSATVSANAARPVTARSATAAGPALDPRAPAWPATADGLGGPAGTGSGQLAREAVGQTSGHLAREAAGQPTGHLAREAAGQPVRSRRLLAGCGWVAAGLTYAWVVGSVKRYSWPATFSVIALGCLMVAVGWQGPLRRRAALTGLALHRAWLWAVVLVSGGLWELSSLLQQPHLTTDSYAHPTISALTDPMLASHPGRSVALGAWLLIGWFLVGR